MASDNKKDKVLVEDPNNWGENREEPEDEEEPLVNRRTVLKAAALTVPAFGGAAIAGRELRERHITQEDPGKDVKAVDDTPTETPEETATEQPLPEEYEVNIVPGKNTELRKQIPQKQISQYQQEFEADLITDSNVFSQTSSQEFRNMEVDLLALEYWHDNDYSNLNQLGRHRGELETLVKAVNNFTTEEATQIINKHDGVGEANISNPEELQRRVEKVKTEPKSMLYENGEYGQSVGHYEQNKALNPNNLKQFLDQIHPLIFNIEWEIDAPAISTEDEKFAAVIQQATDQYTDFDIHAWAFDLPRANGNTHGNGLIYNQTNNELRVLETVAGGDTAVPRDTQLHPLIENSNYLPPELREQMDGQTSSDNTAYREWWHPIRFQGQAPKNKPIDFKFGKRAATTLFTHMTTGFEDEDINDIWTESGISATTEYIADITEKLRNYNQNNIKFNEMLNQSKVFNKLYAEDEEYLVGGTVEDPWYVKVGEDFNHDAVWEDQEGEYDNYVEELEPQTTETAQSLGESGEMLESPA